MISKTSDAVEVANINTTKKEKKWPYKLSLRRNKNIYPEYKQWLSFYPKFHKLSFKLEIGSYFDERLQLVSQLTTILAIFGLITSIWISLPIFCWLIIVAFLIAPWGEFYLNLPIYSGRNDCENPEYGFYLYAEGRKVFDSFWWKWGETTTCFHMPWEWECYRTSCLRKDGTWEHDMKKDKGSKSFWDKDKWRTILWGETYPYTYVLKSGTVQERLATLRVEEREWRWKSLMWFPYINITRKTIAVDFNDEVGEGTGSWKGGTLGCSYQMRHGELPEQTLRRMEKERKFNR